MTSMIRAIEFSIIAIGVVNAMLAMWLIVSF